MYMDYLIYLPYVGTVCNSSLTLISRLSVVWIDSCTGRTKYKNERIKPDNPIHQLSKNSDCWLSGYLLSEKMAEVRKVEKLNQHKHL